MSTGPNSEKQTIHDIMREIEAKSAKGVYIFRGENKDHCKVSSKLYRDYKNIENVNIEVIQKELLDAAKRHIGHLPHVFHTSVASPSNASKVNAEATVNFGILTEIQHYSGKTNLIDFTTDYFIALFFACDGRPDEDGRVILQNTEEINKDWIMYPQTPVHRIIAQKSVFIRHPKGYIEPEDEDIVTIPAALKQPLLEYLRKDHRISTETIYNDLHGYIENQDLHGDAYTNLCRGIVCHQRGIDATIIKEKKEAYEKAINYYNEAIELKPDNIEAYSHRGAAYSDKGDYDRAIKDLNKAIELNPYYVNAYNNRGAAYSDKGEYDRAIKDLNKAIELNPNDVNAYYNRGVAYKDKGELDLAIKDYDKAIELNPNDVSAYNNRGVAYKDKDELDLAIKDYDKAIELKSDFAMPYNNRGVAYKDKGELDLAIKDHDKAIELNPDNAEAYTNRGLIYEAKGDYDRAIKDHDKALELNPNDVSAHNNRGTAYAKKGEYDRAIKDLNRALELNLDNAKVYTNRGLIYEAKGDYDRAIKDYDKALELNSNLTEVSIYRDRAYRKKNP